ncbi:MAG: hypothetical protein ACTHL8_11580 [Burkholderiaceae bacterium]
MAQRISGLSYRLVAPFLAAPVLIDAETDHRCDDADQWLRTRAEYNVVTRKVRNARLLEFVEYASNIDERQLERLSRRGAEAWKGVGDATAWVDELRGGKD